MTVGDGRLALVTAVGDGRIALAAISGITLAILLIVRGQLSGH
jgi:hypothetical protein